MRNGTSVRRLVITPAIRPQAVGFQVWTPEIGEIEYERSSGHLHLRVCRTDGGIVPGPEK